MKDEILNIPISQVYMKYPFLVDFFLSCALSPPATNSDMNLAQWFNNLEYFTLDEVGLDREELPEQLELFIQNMEARMRNSAPDVESITILGGFDKNGTPEKQELTLNRGDVVSIVGPTGSGKSRLLSDIEWLAQRDTPTGRKILVNNQVPPADWRFSIEKKLVAQLSQNMNFVMDITVGCFLQIHCDSRMIANSERKIQQIIMASNTLAGEPISPDMPVTSLSGGQSRALMIADTAFVSTSPIILIDEIENAGINRKNAIELLVRSEKIVLMATHDPILALQADRRIVIKNGAICKLIHTSAEEKKRLKQLEAMNAQLVECREQLRDGFTVS